MGGLEGDDEHARLRAAVRTASHLGLRHDRAVPYVLPCQRPVWAGGVALRTTHRVIRAHLKPHRSSATMPPGCPDTITGLCFSATGLSVCDERGAGRGAKTVRSRHDVLLYLAAVCMPERFAELAAVLCGCAWRERCVCGASRKLAHTCGDSYRVYVCPRGRAPARCMTAVIWSRDECLVRAPWSLPQSSARSRL